MGFEPMAYGLKVQNRQLYRYHEGIPKGILFGKTKAIEKSPKVVGR
jgi:hypothetical protein